MKILLNGKEHPLEQKMSVSELLASMNLSDKPVVVEHNQKALFPREYQQTTLNEGDQVEIISIAAGG